MAKRIAVEEHWLKNMFDDEWVVWQRTVPSGLPFIP